MDMMTNRFNWCAILTDSNRFANSGGKKFIYTKTDFFLFKYCTNFNFEMHICECRLRLHARYTTSVHRFFSGRSNELALRAKIIVAWCNFINHTFKMQNSIWIIASFFFFVRMHFFGISKLRLYRIFTTFLCMRKIGTCFDSQRLCFTFFRREKKLVKQYEFVLQFSLVESQIAWHFAIHKSTYTISKFYHHTQFEINEKPTVNILLSFWISLGTWQKSFRCSEMEIECSASL